MRHLIRRAQAGRRATTADTRIVGSSPAAQALREQIARYAPYDIPVLIEGESGTGKELAAQALHRLGLRSRSPFVAVNCATLTPNLAAAELFGATRGAYTGATSSRDGLFRAANGGTLFLDEVGELSLGVQAMLLRVLQEREVRPVGGTNAVAVNVRVVSATMRNVLGMVAAGKFREDLYYRLSVLQVQTPALRDRAEDIPELAVVLLEEAPRGVRRRLRDRRITDGALRLLKTQPWPGNVRQLRAVLIRAAIYSDSGVIQARDVRAALTDQTSARPVPPEPLTPERLVAALKDAPNTAAAARELGIARSTLYERMKAMGIR